MLLDLLHYFSVWDSLRILKFLCYSSGDLGWVFKAPVYAVMVIKLLTWFSLVIGHGSALWQHFTKWLFSISHAISSAFMCFIVACIMPVFVYSFFSAQYYCGLLPCFISPINLTVFHHYCTIKITNNACFQFCVSPSGPTTCSVSMWFLIWNGLLFPTIPCSSASPYSCQQETQPGGETQWPWWGKQQRLYWPLNTAAPYVNCNYTQHRASGRLDRSCFWSQWFSNISFGSRK